MYILKNAYKNLLRNKGRNIIVGIIILTMLSFTSIAMIINSTTENVIKNYKEQFGSQIFIQTDVDKLKQQQQDGEWYVAPETSDKVKLAIAESEYLKETLFKVMFTGNTKDLKGLDEGQNGGGGNIKTNTIENNDYYEVNVTVVGHNSTDLLTDFKEGKRKIIEGKLYSANNECIISEDYAKLNKLKVNDKIVVRDSKKSSTYAPLELTVVGIFYDETKSQYGDYISAATNPRNEVLTTYETLKYYQDNVAKEKLFSITSTYFLKSPDLLDEFNKEAHEKGLDDVYTMSTDELSYNKIVKPAESLANVSNVFLIGVLIIGGVLLILLSVLSIRERKYEIGVLRAMGMKKLKVVRGIIYESFITITICLIIGLSIGALFASPVSEMITANNQEKAQNDMFVAYVEPEKIEVSLTSKAVFDVSVIAIVIALISSTVGVLYISRYEPMKILSERN